MTTMKKFKVSFDLDEGDISYFRRLFRIARKGASGKDPDEIIAAANDLVKQVRSVKKTPRFIVEAVDILEDLAALVLDADYKPPKSVQNQVLGALAYFANPDDLIHDEIPVLGFLDDAIMIRIVEGQFKHELWGYRKFRKWRDGAEHRPWTKVAKSRLPNRLAEMRKKIRGEIGAKAARDEARGLVGF